MVTFNGKSLARMVKDNTVNLEYFQTDTLWYNLDVDGKIFRFPVPISATGDAVYKSSERAPVLMKFIRKELERIDLLVNEEKENAKNYETRVPNEN